MNTSKILILTLVTFILVSTSCNKENLTTENSTVFIDNFLHYEIDYETLAKNKTDYEDELVNWVLIKLTEQTKKIISDESIRKEIIELAKQNENGYVKLSELINRHPEFNDIYTRDLADYLMTYKGIQYEPVINIPNIETANFSEQPLISPGIEIEDDEARGIDDFIFSWYLSQNGTFHEIALGEKQALEMRNPLFIISPNSVKESNQSKPSLKPIQSNFNSNSRTSTEFHSNEFRINEGYESSGKSEFCATAVGVSANGTAGFILKKDNGTYHEWKLIAKVPQSDIGTDLNHWEHISDDETPRTDYSAFINTFERDWARQKRALGTCTAFSITIYLQGKMKYDTDWYAFDPSGSVDQDIDINQIYNTWLRCFINDKGYLYIWRVGS